MFHCLIHINSFLYLCLCTYITFQRLMLRAVREHVPSAPHILGIPCTRQREV